jgi:hypothetical protein
MDLVLNLDPNDIISPGPILEYEYKGETHIYITDFYYQPYNLIIEVKDGGKNPNNRNMPEYRAKQIEKEKYIIKNTNYNYLRLTDNNLKQLVITLAELKMQMVENSGERVINVNESNDINEFMSMVAYAPVVGLKQNKNCTYVRNYMQNNVFAGTCLSDEYKFDNLIRVNDDGILVKEKKLDDKYEFDNHVICIPKSKDEVSAIFTKYIGKSVNENFIYEKLFGKKLYTNDQIYMEEGVFVIPTFEDTMKILSSVVENYIKSEQFVSFGESVESILEDKEFVASEDGKLISEVFNLPPQLIKTILNQLEVYHG